jgi:hypothetical protein
MVISGERTTFSSLPSLDRAYFEPVTRPR